MDEGYFKHLTEYPELSTQDVEIIRKQLPEARWIVDIGCGRGGFVEIYRRQLGDAIVLDSEPTAGRICRVQGLPFTLANAEQLPFASDSLDMVRAKEIIEHLPDPRPMLQEICRALRPGGLCLSRVPTHFSTFYPINNFWDDYTHIRPVTRLGLRRLLEDTGFEIEFITGYTAGRNAAERLLGRVLGRVLPHTWLALARKPRA